MSVRILNRISDQRFQKLSNKWNKLFNALLLLTTLKKLENQSLEPFKQIYIKNEFVKQF